MSTVDLAKEDENALRTTPGLTDQLTEAVIESVTAQEDARFIKALEADGAVHSTPVLANTCPSEKIICREQFGRLLNDMGLTGEAVEIGTFIGEFAIDLLAHWKGKVLHVVDPWESYEDYLSDLDKATHEPLEPKKGVFLQRIAPFSHRVVVHQGYSPEALDVFTHESLDFGYIDGNHKKPYVAADLAALWPKIKPGGILAGHDFESSGPWANDTRAAVLEFFGTMGLPVYWCSGDAHSWYVYKPNKLCDPYTAACPKPSTEN